MKDLISNISITQPLNPILATSTRTGSSVDLRGYNSCVLVANIGFSLDTLTGSLYWTVKIQHSDNGSSWSDCATTDVYGGVVSYVIDAAAEDETAYKFGYAGEKRYVRLVNTPTGVISSGMPMGFTAIRSTASLSPVV